MEKPYFSYQQFAAPVLAEVLADLGRKGAEVLQGGLEVVLGPDVLDGHDVAARDQLVLLLAAHKLLGGHRDPATGQVIDEGWVPAGLPVETAGPKDAGYSALQEQVNRSVD